MSSGGATFLPTDPWSVVDQGWDRFTIIGNDTLAGAQDLIDALTSFTVNEVQFNAQFNPPPDLTQGFAKPDRPVWYELEPFDPGLPETLEQHEVETPDFGEAPTLDATPYVPNFDTKPSAFNEPAPQENFDFAQVNIPSAPVITYPDLPELIPVDIPSAPDLDEHHFQGVRPTIDFDEPDTSINFTEEAYESELLDQVRGEIKRMLDTGTGMPMLVEQMLVDKARAREDVEADRAVQEALERWAAKGFTLPSGVVNKQITQTRQNNQNQTNTLNREIFIQRRKEEIENFRFAISQGIALENVLIQVHMTVMDRALRQALAVTDLAFRVLDAKVAIFNAKLQAFNTDAQVYRTLIEAEAQKLEQFRLEIQAEALKGEVNRDKVAVYTAQLDSLRTKVGVFTAQVDAARTVAQTNQVQADIYRTRVQAYASRVGAKSEEFRAWSTQIQGELGKQQRYELETQAFIAEVQGCRAQLEAKSFEPELKLRINDQYIREHLAQIEYARTKIQKEVSRWGAEAEAFRAKSSMYVAEGQMALTQNDANLRAYGVEIEKARFGAQQALAVAQTKIEESGRNTQILSATLDSAARTSAQLAAGAMSAVSLSAGISGGTTVDLTPSSPT